MLRKTLTGLALVALLAPAVSAETVDELIAKNIEAKGGMDKIKSVQTMKMTGKMLAGPGMEVPFSVTAKRPLSNRIEFTVQGMTGVQACDGTHAWMVMPFTGKKDPEEMPAEATELMLEQAEFDGPLVDYKTKGHKVELVGKEQYEGADAYKLKVTLKGGTVRYVFLDADNFLEIATEGKTKQRDAEFDFVSSIGDYKEVEGRMIAHSISTGAKGDPARRSMTFEKVEFNVTAPDSLFNMPAGTRPAPVAAVGDSAGTAKAAGADSAKAAVKKVEAQPKAGKKN